MAINQHQRKRKSSAAPVCQPETAAEEKESKNLQKTGLKTLIHEHSLFFDRLVELIPARFYLPAADKDKVWFQGLSKADKESAKKQSKENLKKAKREKLDPENAQTTLDLLKKSIEDEKPAPEEEDDDVFTQKHSDQAKVDAGSGSGSGSVTYEELRERLRRRIEELRGNRNAASDENEGFSKQKFKKSEKRDLHLGKSTRYAGSDANDSKDARLPNKKKDAAATTEKLSSPASASSSGGANLDLAYGGVRIDEERGGKRGKKRKASKIQMLEKAKKLKEVMEDPGIGPSVAAKHSWKAATSRAAGEKVHDNPKLLKESINKERQKKKKSAKKWKERQETVEKSKAAKQQGRMQNITQRAQDKKMRKIAKREKKLLRPGFEGRKQGFINE